MTMLKMLSAISANGGSMRHVDILNIDPSDPCGTNRRIRAMLSSGLLSGSPEAYGTISLTPQGQIVLDELTEQADQRNQHRSDRKAEEKRGFRRDLLFALIGSAVTIIAEVLAKVLI